MSLLGALYIGGGGFRPPEFEANSHVILTWAQKGGSSDHAQRSKLGLHLGPTHFSSPW
jgi:hypothetical protein